MLVKVERNFPLVDQTKTRLTELAVVAASKRRLVFSLAPSIS